MERLKAILKKIITKETILYVIFGVFTTIVNLGVFYVLANIIKINENIANFIAVVIAVLFAYITNKDLVFHANAQTMKERISQFVKFMAGRSFTMVVEMIGGAGLFMLPIPNIISKIIITVVVVVLNFFISKFFAFKK